MTSNLVEVLADSLSPVKDDGFRSVVELPQNLQSGYRQFLTLSDGGHTRDKFFHFFGRNGPAPHNLLDWNRSELWKRHYGLDDNTFVFAEDLFGTQFCFDVRGNRRVVKMLIPDGGGLSLCANTFEDFLETEVFGDATNGRIRQLADKFYRGRGETAGLFSHITCKTPASLGGVADDVENWELMPSVTNLKILGQITAQIRNLASGTKVVDIKIDLENEGVVLITR